MKKLLILLLLLTSSFSAYALSIECDASFKVEGDIASTGTCQFGEYQIEFFKNLKAGTAHLCDDQPFCGVQADWKGAVSYIDTIVIDSNGNIVAKNLVENVDVILLDSSSLNTPYLVLQTKRPGSAGPGRNFHIYTALPEFHKVGKIGPLWNSQKGIYTNDQHDILVDIWIKDLPPDIPSMANSISYPITVRFIDNQFVPALEQMKSELKVYDEVQLQNIYSKAEQINSLVTKYVVNPNNEIEEFNLIHPVFLLGDIHQLGFMRTIIELVREGRIDLAWEFFDLAIPSTYDLRQEYNLPIYKTKSIMKETIANWLTNLEYWDEINQLQLPL